MYERPVSLLNVLQVIIACITVLKFYQVMGPRTTVRRQIVTNCYTHYAEVHSGAVKN